MLGSKSNKRRCSCKHGLGTMIWSVDQADATVRILGVGQTSRGDHNRRDSGCQTNTSGIPADALQVNCWFQTNTSYIINRRSTNQRVINEPFAKGGRCIAKHGATTGYRPTSPIVPTVSHWPPHSVICKICRLFSCGVAVPYSKTIRALSKRRSGSQKV